MRVKIKETAGDRKIVREENEVNRHGNVSVPVYLELMFSITSSELSSCSRFHFSQIQRVFVGEGTDVNKAFTSQVGSSLRFFPWLSSHWRASMVDHGIPEISRASCRLLAYHRIGRGTSINN